MGMRLPPDLTRKVLDACRDAMPCTRAVFYVPVKIDILANARLHWAKKARIVAEQRAAVRLVIGDKPLPSLPVTVTFTRIGKRVTDDDNLAHAAKGARDEVAAIYGEDDGSPLYVWRYRQEIGKEYGCEIEIVARSLAEYAADLGR